MSARRVSATIRERISREARYRCGYCLTAQIIVGPLLEIEHIIPVARGGTSRESNLWLSCPLCNSHKSDRVNAVDPATGALVNLFNPRNEEWSTHFEWAAEGTIVHGITPVGRATVLALAMNDPDIVAARRLWVLVGWHPPRD